MPKSAVSDIVQCETAEAAGTIVYASDHEKIRVYPVSTVSRKLLLNLTKSGPKLFWKLYFLLIIMRYDTYDSKIYFTSRDSCNFGKLVEKHY